MRLSGAAVAAATGGIWQGGVPDELAAISTDTRHFNSGDAFLALRGPHFDGHRFGVSVADRASALIGDRRGNEQWSGLGISRLLVDDTLQALGEIAHAWRRQLRSATVIAISGSYGKTSLRSMLECGFSAMGLAVAATRANLNNLIGVPQTLLAVPADADLAIIECGISERGEMERLAQIVAPDMAVLTGIAAAHSEGLGGLAGVVHEKAMLLAHLNDGGSALLGAGVSELLDRYQIRLPADRSAMDRDGLVDWRLTGCELELYSGSEQAQLTLQLPARHWAENIALAALVMLRYCQRRRVAVGLTEIASALGRWQPVAGRMQVLRGEGESTLLDDCYNANPVSMQAAIDTLRAMPGSHVAILGDMAELGADSRRAHQQIDIAGLERVWLIGPEMRALADKYPESTWFGDVEAALAAVAQTSFGKDETVLVKASRSMHLERVVEALRAGEVAHAL